jgi:hypothetical protein
MCNATFDASEKYYTEVRNAAYKVLLKQGTEPTAALDLAKAIACEAANNSDIA